MTNDLDHLLEQVEDALEEGESLLWQPDLTALVLPSLPVHAAGEASEEDRQAREQADGQAAFQAQRNQDVLEALQAGQQHDALRREQALAQHPAESGWETLQARQRWTRSPGAPAGASPQTERQWLERQPGTEHGSLWAGEQSAQFQAVRSDPPLLVRLRDLEQAQASLGAVSRTQSGGASSSFSRGLAGSDIRPEPAFRQDSPMAAAAAAAREEDQARAVDRAFQRDSRRYDRGFSLY